MCTAFWGFTLGLGFVLLVYSVHHCFPPAEADEPGMPKTGILKRVGATIFYMKKFLLILVLSSATVISSFTKDFKTNAPNAYPPSQWTVSSYGFLVFPTVFELNDFINFVKTKTHAEIQQYITDSLSGFSSHGSSIYSNSDVTVTESEAHDYAMNTYRIIQTEGVVLRPISEQECSVNFEFVLAITPAYLTSTTYGYLQSGTYDQYSMNKFATNPDTESTPIVAFCALTPYGHEETDPTLCPSDEFPLPLAYLPVNNANAMNKFATGQVTETSETAAFMGQTSSGNEETNANNCPIGTEKPRLARPFWGWGPQSSETCVQNGTWFNPQTNTWEPKYDRCLGYYVFWIRVHNDCYVAYGCSGNHFAS